MKVMVELKDDWIEDDHVNNLASFLGNFKSRFQDKLFNRAVEEALKQTKIPKIKITPKEVKNRMLQILAENALNKE